MNTPGLLTSDRPASDSHDTAIPSSTPPQPTTSHSSFLPATDHQISPVKCDISQLKKGVTITAQLKLQASPAEQSVCKVVSHSGRVTGRYGHCWNVQEEKRNISSIDFKHSISSFTVLHVETPYSGLTDELCATPIFVVNHNSEIQEAKQRELANWSDHNVCDEVPNIGQPFMTVRWVVTQKIVDHKPSLKARSVAHGFQETQEH